MAGIFPGCPGADVALSHHVLPGKGLGPHTSIGAAGQGSGMGPWRVLLDSLLGARPCSSLGTNLWGWGPQSSVSRLELGEGEAPHPAFSSVTGAGYF